MQTQEEKQDQTRYHNTEHYKHTRNQEKRNSARKQTKTLKAIDTTRTNTRDKDTNTMEDKIAHTKSRANKSNTQ